MYQENSNKLAILRITDLAGQC